MRDVVVVPQYAKGAGTSLERLADQNPMEWRGVLTQLQTWIHEYFPTTCAARVVDWQQGKGEALARRWKSGEQDEQSYEFRY